MSRTYCRYIAWQVHERVEGEYYFERENDFVNFTKIADSLGLLVIIRAGKKKTTKWSDATRDLLGKSIMRQALSTGIAT